MAGSWGVSSRQMRLNKYLAEAGAASRRKADELILSGRVKVNGEVANQLGAQIDPIKDSVTLDDRPLGTKHTRIIYLLNKPKGVVTTASDPFGKPTVLSLIPSLPRVFPCGRLDEDTMGLVLLTNDGNLCYQLTHPKFEHQKEYLVEGISTDTDSSWKKLHQPITLKDGPVKIDQLKLEKKNNRKLNFLITVHEGRNRMIRRLCAACGIEVINLTRIRLGQYELGSLLPGKYEVITLQT